MTVRPATRDDAEAIGDVHVGSWRWAYRGVLPDALLDNLVDSAWRDRWVAVLSRDDEPARRRRTWVAELDGGVCGFCHAGPARDEDTPEDVAEIYAVYVTEQVAGRGAGGALIRHALHELSAQGYRAAVIWVLRENRRARSVYEHTGFALDGAEKVDTDSQGYQYDEVRYRIALG